MKKLFLMLASIGFCIAFTACKKKEAQKKIDDTVEIAEVTVETDAQDIIDTKKTTAKF
ncbi:MAG TPA: hypothetical protein VEK38_04130 [Candidatus Bathyarchaeia archaeon]|nr:hypothetical protein [Candidatus Bathyarchaeia archaeon]